MGTKYIDIGIAIFLGYLAYTRFMEGRYGFAALFIVLFILNIITAVVKHNLGKNKTETNHK